MAGLCLSTTLAEGSTLMLGNGEQNAVKWEHADPQGWSGFATHYVRYRMRAYMGNEITGVMVCFDETAVGCQGRAYVASDAAGQKVLAEQPFTVADGGQWQTIRFDQPYAVTGSEVYVGYEVQNASYLMAALRLTPGDDRCRLHGEAWSTYGESDYAPAMLTLLSGDKLPQHEVTLMHTLPARYVASGSAAPSTVTLCNLGTEPVSSIEVTYHTGDDTQTETIADLSIANRQIATLSLNGPIVATEGDHKAWLEVTRVNGVADAAPYDNSSSTWTLCCRDELVERRVLMEVFSTEKCTNCPQAHANIDRLFGQNPRVVEVGHHAGFYTDDLTVGESVDYEWFYTPNRGTYAPAAMFDRTCCSTDLPKIFSDDVPVINGELASTMQPTYDLVSQTPAQATVDLTLTYDEAQRQLTANVSGRRLLPTEDAASLRLNVVVVEDSVMSLKQAGARGVYYHRHVLRQCLTGTWGEAIDLDRGYSKSYTVTLPEAWRAEHVSVVAFVSNYDATNRNNCRVLNSNEAELASYVTSGIQCVPTDECPATPHYDLWGRRSQGSNQAWNISQGKITYLRH